MIRHALFLSVTLFGWISDALWLETMSKPLYEKQVLELNFYREIFKISEYLKWDSVSFADICKVAQKYGLNAMDAIHITTAMAAGVEEFVTTEKSSKPLFRVEGIKFLSLADPTSPDAY